MIPLGLELGEVGLLSREAYFHPYHAVSLQGHALRSKLTLTSKEHKRLIGRFRICSNGTISRLMLTSTSRSMCPIGAGYGTSAAGTAASCLALADVAQLPVTFNEIGKLTHVAEVVNQTGLGTASAILVGGFVLVTEPGAPGFGEVDRLLFPKGHSIICAYLDATPTRKVLSQSDIASRVNPAGNAGHGSNQTKPLSHNIPF